MNNLGTIIINFGLLIVRIIIIILLMQQHEV